MVNLFSCSECEVELENGAKMFDGVVMDGTVVRILVALPNFVRDIRIVLPVTSIADRQDIMRTPKYWQFIESIMLSAQNSCRDTEFEVM